MVADPVAMSPRNVPGSCGERLERLAVHGTKDRGGGYKPPAYNGSFSKVDEAVVPAIYSASTPSASVKTAIPRNPVLEL